MHTVESICTSAEADTFHVANTTMCTSGKHKIIDRETGRQKGQWKERRHSEPWVAIENIYIVISIIVITASHIYTQCIQYSFTKFN